MDTIRYSVANSCGTTFANYVISIDAEPSAGTIIGDDSLCIGRTTTLTKTASGGAWTSVYPGIATVLHGVVSGISAGIDTIKYSVSNSCGNASASFPIAVHDNSQCDAANNVNPVTHGIESIKVYPNPTSGLFNIVVPTSYKNVEIIIIDIIGKVVDKQHIVDNSGETIQFNLEKASRGAYIIKVIADETMYVNKLIVQ